MNGIQTSNHRAVRSAGRLMLCNVGRLGDTILRNSILDAAFRTYAAVDYICGPGNAELVRNDSRISEITVFDKSMRSWGRLMRASARHRYQAFIELKNHDSLTSLLIAGLFRSSVKTGCNSNRLRPFHRDARSVCEPNQHQIETMRRIGELAGLEAGDYKPSLVLPAESVDWFRRRHEREKPYIFLNISATGWDRMWPVERWERYLRGCGLDAETILINGMPKHRSMVEDLCRKFPRAVAFQPRQFTDVVAAVADARLVVTVDTAIVHVCSALDKPIVALFSANKTNTECKPLSSHQLVIETRCPVVDIDPDEAIAETKRHGLPWREAIAGAAMNA